MAQVSPTLTVGSYNLLAQGFVAPFANTPAADLAWPARRQRIAAALAALDADVLCVQELQSSSRGWGRALSGADAAGPDHAQQLRLLLAARGYDGCYQVMDDDARSSYATAKHDVAWTPEAADAEADDADAAAAGAATASGEAAPAAPSGKRNAAWPCSSAPGARIGNALFWRRLAWTCVAQRPVLLSSVITDLTKERGNLPAYRLLQNSKTAILCLLRHAATGALVLVGCTHLPAPSGFESSEAEEGGGGEGAAPPAAAAAAAALLPKGAVLQVQLAEAIVREAAEMLEHLGLSARVPFVLAGDFNAKPESACYRLLTTGGLPPGDPSLSGLVAAKPRPAGAAQPAGASAAQPAAVALPFPRPDCAGGGPFASAYAVVNGREPDFTNLRLCYGEDALRSARAAAVEAARAAGAKSAAAAAAKVAAAGLRAVPGETIFSAPLDYVFYRNPRAPDGGGVVGSVTTLRAVAVRATPTAEEARAECGALPSRSFPSDHVPIAATFALAVAVGGSGPAGGAGSVSGAS